MELNRRTWMSLWMPAVVGAAEPQAGTAPPRIITGPCLQTMSETSAAVMWITSGNATAAVEVIGADGVARTFQASQHGLIDGNSRVHMVKLGGLAPGAVYRYRVVSREIVRFFHYKIDYGATVTSEYSEFRTFDRRKREFSFLVFNDMHDVPASFGELLPAAGAAPYDFVVLNGDTVSHFSKEENVARMMDAAVAGFASRTPLFWLRGNHETRGEMAREMPRYIHLPGGRYYFSFDHGPVHFTVLDTGEDKIDDHPEYGGMVNFFPYRKEEGEWLKDEVRTEAFRRARYRVVICHMPFARKPVPQGNANRQSLIPGKPNPFVGMADCFDNFGATLKGAGVDMMISGHIHNAMVVPPDGERHNYPIVCGGGNAGDRRTIIRVNAGEKDLTARIFRPDGSVFETCQVKPRR